MRMKSYHVWDFSCFRTLFESDRPNSGIENFSGPSITLSLHHYPNSLHSFLRDIYYSVEYDFQLKVGRHMYVTVNVDISVFL